MYEKALESLSADTRFENVLSGSLDYKGERISISLDPDDLEMKSTLALATKFLQNLEDYEERAVSKIVDEFFDNYNDNWRNDDEPRLTEQEFKSKLKFTGINFLSDELVDFFYEENGMFGYHSLIAQVFDGESFSDATMFG